MQETQSRCSSISQTWTGIVDYVYSWSQVGRALLDNALSTIFQDPSSNAILPGFHSLDDAAVIKPPPPGHVLLQTTDFLRSFVADPYIFGVIAANHSLSVSGHFVAIDKTFRMGLINA